MTIQITVIVCTCRRPNTLGRTLDSLLRQTYSPSRYEIIVIDNCPCRETQAAVTRRAGVAVNIRYAAVSQPGLSLARNRGIDLSRGNIIAFIDDDALARPDWLAAIDAVFQKKPGLQALTGPVLPLPTMVLPVWFPKRLIAHISLSDRRRVPGPMHYPYYGFGVNMAVKRSVFQQAGGFDTTFGRVGSDNYRTGEETELFLRIERRGGKLRFHPGMKVYHDINQERVTPKTLCRQSFWIGESSARMERKWMPAEYSALKAGLAPLKIIAGILVWSSALLPGCRKLPVFVRCVVYNHLGYLYGLKNFLGNG